ncbi:phosphotransferase [Terrabacter sp. NPDC080008]|uniref:phosphotransferase n=1 Tax=Terrabacter sp. NPDC080008 TaxID=3155176 RepID=UPI003450D788
MPAFRRATSTLMTVQTSTHDVTFAADQVRKQFVSWGRSEPDREWACLTVLAEHAPGLAPRPLRRGWDGGRPFVVMERLPGHPLGGAPLSEVQMAELGRTLCRLFAVPATAVRAAGLGERILGPSTMAKERVGMARRAEGCAGLPG